ncbi:hypothetical protein A0J61_06455 [Choanephora cucurbitarum]|uniref:Uncharacterized protein n=1 Tax=Choanephora cucurbitarum TaxID=101091 RepID=A0A1C7N995_9FUNG|nr:hypothetical protein A0J61_06455 [Choanephora cucurbitarum]
MVRKKSRGRPTKKETEQFTPSPLDSEDLLRHVKPKRTIKDNHILHDEHDQHVFIKLLEAINMRATHITQIHPTFPSMDLSALYCTGIIIQEYVRYLSTDLLQQHQALENRPVLTTHFSQAEREAQSIQGILQTHKPSSRLQSHEMRPNLEKEAGALERKRRAYASHQMDVMTCKTGYEDLLEDPEWKGVLRKKRDPEADAKAAALRRAHQTKKVEIQPAPYLPPKQNIPPPISQDMFDAVSDRKRRHPSSDCASKKKRFKSNGF